MENQAHRTVTGIKGYVKQEEFDALLKRVEELEKRTGLTYPRKIREPFIQCPNGHTDRFEDFGRAVVTNSVASFSSKDRNSVLNSSGEVIEPGYRTPSPYTKDLRCLTCGEVFEVKFNRQGV